MSNRFVLLAMLFLLAAATAAHATSVTDLTTHTLLFYDDFENSTTAPATGNAYNDSPDADPIADVGTWSNVQETGNPGVIQITTSTASPDPGPFQGSRYLRIYRNGGRDNNQLLGTFASTINSSSSDVIELESMVFVPVDGTVFVARGNLAIEDSAGRYLALVRPDGDGHVIATGGDGSGDNLHFVSVTTVPYTAGVWQDWRIDYAVNAHTFTVSVDGVSSDPITSGAFGVPFQIELSNGSNNAGSIYFDAPEPASLTLLALGGFAALPRRKK